MGWQQWDDSDLSALEVRRAALAGEGGSKAIYIVGEGGWWMAASVGELVNACPGGD
jgi:hypothetical protein